MLVYLELGLVCTKNHWLVEYSPKKCLNSLEKLFAHALKQNDENSNGNLVANTKKVLAKKSCA